MDVSVNSCCCELSFRDSLVIGFPCLFAIPVAVIAIIIKAAVDKKRKKNESNENTADKAEMK